MLVILRLLPRRMALVTNSGIAVTSGLLWAQAAAGLDSVVMLLVLVGVRQALLGANGAARLCQWWGWRCCT